MASAIVLVNGLPGAGKTTLATALAEELGAVVLSKDAVKEALASVLPVSAVVPDLGVVAIQAVWSMAARLPGTVIVESWWFRPRDLRFVHVELPSVGTAAAVEVWCDVPAETARRRFAGRVRSALHEDARRLAADWDDWAAGAEPLALTPVLEVDTSRPVDLAALARAVRRELAGRPPSAAAHLDSRPPPRRRGQPARSVPGPEITGSHRGPERRRPRADRLTAWWGGRGRKGA